MVQTPPALAPLPSLPCLPPWHGLRVSKGKVKGGCCLSEARPQGRHPPSPSLYRLAPINNWLSEASHSWTVSGCCANKEKAKTLLSSGLFFAFPAPLPPQSRLRLSLVAGVGRTNGNLLYAALSPPGPTTLASSASSTSQHRSSTSSPGSTSTTAIASIRVRFQPSHRSGLSTAKSRERCAEFGTGRSTLLSGEPLQHPKRDKRIHVRR